MLRHQLLPTRQKTFTSDAANGIILGWQVYPVPALLFCGGNYAATRTAERCSPSASVATVDNAIAALRSARQSGVNSGVEPIAATSKASRAKKHTAFARGVIVGASQRPL